MSHLLQILLGLFPASRLVPGRKQEEFGRSRNARKHSHQQLFFWNVSDLGDAGQNSTNYIRLNDLYVTVSSIYEGYIHFKRG